jgi:hypothetical protein
VLGFISCKNKDAKQATSDSYQKSKETIEDIEKKQPSNFLTVSGRNKHNLIGQTVIKATISNQATVVTYKDVKVRLTFISKTGTKLEEDEETIYEEIKPGASVDFKSKYFAPKGTASVNLKISEASVVE